MNIPLNYIRLFVLLGIFLVFSGKATAQQSNVNVTVNIRGVHSSDISLMALTSSNLFKPILELKDMQRGDTATLAVPADYLPGEFVLHFDYRENASSTPYPSERYIFINDQDLEFRVNPMFANNPDSSHFQPGERENSAFARFSLENAVKREKLGLIEYFLMNYDDPGSEFYQMGKKEYEKRRQSYNEWIQNSVERDKQLFVSALYKFQYVPELSWEGSERDRVINLIQHYFDGVDFDDPRTIRTTDMKKWMDSYVNLYGQLTTSLALRDSLFPAAGRNAIEKAKQGHPRVYGWMVDYFYRGYEANGIDAGMKILEPYVNDTNCLTSKRLEINRRLEGMKTLLPGSPAPEIRLATPDGSSFVLSDYHVTAGKILVVFWSADCPHCMEMIEKIYPWQRQPDVSAKLEVVAVSLDETETEVAAWEMKRQGLQGWKHLRAAEGVNSQVAMDYFVLATPIMVLMDAKTRDIIALPNSLEDLRKLVN